MSFKLLAIRPVKKCDRRFMKNLELNHIYKFYNNYNFILSEPNSNNHQQVSKIVQEEDAYADLYNNSLKNSPKINISAIVGKNGSGKSSLLELLYVACYVIASRKEILYGVAGIMRKFRLNDQRMSENDRKYLNEIQSVFRDLEVELFYEIDDKIFMISVDDEYLVHKILEGKDDNFDNDGIFKNEDQHKEYLRYVCNQLFFYTISINYSLYGLNENFMGSWVRDLFHKNDGYQTPVVINPFRQEGNIDVNNELHLAQTRLLSNLISDSIIVNGKKVQEIIFELNVDEQNLENTNQVEEDFEIFKSQFGFSTENFVTNVYNGIFRGRKIKSVIIKRENNHYFELLSKYIFRKLVKISRNYKEYNDLAQSPNKIRFFKFVLQLNADRSHITLKLRQVLNILRFNILKNDEESEWRNEQDYYKKTFNRYYKITLKKLVAAVNEIHTNNPNFELVEIIPVGFFIPHIIVKNNTTNDSMSNIDQLSSGEQHYLHTLHSIYYHINNLNSVFSSPVEKIKYNYVNLVLDEIELFFHPEYQRRFIKDLLDGIQNLDIPNINAINIIFSTHSTFILSDVPHTNILRLDDGKDIGYNSSNKTFGANIHNLLDNDFFLKDGFMGEFAKTQLLSLANFLSDEKINNYGWEKEKAKKIIDLVGEPLLKNTLEDLYYSKYSSDLDSEINRLIKIRERK